MIFDYKYIPVINSPRKSAVVKWTKHRNIRVYDDDILGIGPHADHLPYYLNKLCNPKQRIIINEQLSSTLNNGITKLDKHTLEQIPPLLPNSKYFVILSEITPRLCHPGDRNDIFSSGKKYFTCNNDPKTDYYHLRTAKQLHHDLDTLCIELMVPLFDFRQLDPERIKYYQKCIEAGEKPTILALSKFDTLFPEDDEIDDPDIMSVHFITNCIIDGHHKTYAAALANRPVTLLALYEKGVDGFLEMVTDFMQ